MEVLDVNKLIGESTEYDKKEEVELRKPKSWCKSISAFANTVGGVLIFGITNNDEVVGLKSAEKDAEKISEIIKAKLSPIPEFNLSFTEYDDKKLILLHVLKGEETPYYYKDSGNMEAYIRIGNQSVLSNATDLKRLVLRGRNSSFDGLNTAFKFTDFSFSKLRERFKIWTGKSFDEKDFTSFGLVNDDGLLTNAGALLADESPIAYSRVFCTRWDGNTKSGGMYDALDHEEYSGGLISLLYNSETFVKRNSKTMWKKLENTRVEYPDYAHRSYFEAIVNALIHRDYLINGSEVHIDMFNDRMEIYSPGGMIDGTNIQNRNILSIPSMRRNPVIADVFSRLGYMERSGSGLSKIREEYEHAALFEKKKEPQFYSNNTSFLVTLPNLNYDGKVKSKKQVQKKNKYTNVLGELNPKQQEIIEHMEAGVAYSPKEIEDMIGLRASRTRQLVSDLVDKGYILENGATRNRKYIKTNKAKLQNTK